MADRHTPTKDECIYCNGVPTNHTADYISSSLELSISDFWRHIHISLRIPKSLEQFAYAVLLGLNEICTILGIISYRTTIEKAPTERTRSILREAQKRGIPVELMHIFGKPLEVFRAFLKTKNKNHFSWHYFDSLPIVVSNSEEGYDWIDDKKLFNKKFTHAKLPVAKSIVVKSEEAARAAFASLGAPVIAKPRSGSRARHTTVNIKDVDSLVEAYKRARQLCRYVLIENFIPGNLYRATCIGKKIVGIIKFVKPSVVADGVMTVGELLEYHNSHKKYPNLTDVQSNQWFFDAIAHQGYSLDSVPPKGTEIILVEHSERPNGGYFIDVTDDVPEENKALIERAADLCSVSVIGFDIISRDLTKSVSSEPLTFIEGNTLPFIEVHLIPYAGEIRDTPKAIWDLWF